MHAQEISSLKPKLDELGARLVLIGYEEEGAQEFIDGKFWDGDLLIDAPHAAFKALGTQSAGLWTLAKPSVVKELMRANREGVPTNFNGGTKDPTLGGTYIVNNGNLVYEYQHQTFGDHATGEEVLQACTHLVKGEGTMPPGQRGDHAGCSIM
eukprot:gnl/TRDRNA2_/TRDRNA2_59394_c0_seq1.p2 gnl/TRDRNA2_/TRDRNA2_59394_c0~~gnl/TRDRNA2_/TRDRNA2_59394_c0_seq1.p2  ORF type:complete len:153 (+),score=32.13 gnl/TRDRNA2_/TRDRNA2_59394_c0_seq1:247-705(+)